MRFARWFKRQPPVINVHVHIDAADLNVTKLAEKIRAEIIRAQRRGA